MNNTFFRQPDGVVVVTNLRANGKNNEHWDAYKNIIDDNIQITRLLLKSLYKRAGGNGQLIDGNPHFFREGEFIAVVDWFEFNLCTDMDERDKFCGLLIHNGYIKEGE